MQSARSTDEASLGGAELLTPDDRSLPLVAAKLSAIVAWLLHTR